MYRFVSYPITDTQSYYPTIIGSGKRFTYTVIEGLTDSAPGDDWGFSGNDNALHVKSSYPHHEGTWSWGDKLDQTLFLIRNPRWALPSYHSMRFELDFANNWAESFSRIGLTYKQRAPVSTIAFSFFCFIVRIYSNSTIRTF